MSWAPLYLDDFCSIDTQVFTWLGMTHSPEAPLHAKPALSNQNAQGETPNPRQDRSLC